MAKGRRKRLVIRGGLGLVAWFATQLVGIGIAGAGHGWVAPFLFTLALMPLYPATFIRAFAAPSGAIAIDAAILVIAGVLDLLLLRNMLGAEREYFLRMWTFETAGVALWLGLWAAWQMLALANLFRSAWSRSPA
ncbi:MAG TPA: hypothetical protein VFW19_03110 [Allosphingosinicella sp.]|nr:hypothetical protein [Allosphingosinicella sp.]